MSNLISFLAAALITILNAYIWYQCGQRKIKPRATIIHIFSVQTIEEARALELQIRECNNTNVRFFRKNELYKS